MRKARPHDLTPSLFDEPATVEDVAVVTDVGEEIGNTDELDDWDEVPQLRFLSWSRGMQLHYCWRRDLDAALRADSINDAMFFLQRAAMYRAQIDLETPYVGDSQTDNTGAT